MSSEPNLLKSPRPSVPRHLLRRLADGNKLGEEHQLQGLFILADLSRFTELTERFSRSSSHGAEEISRVVNRLFDPIIDEVIRHGGSVLQFAGDSMLAYFPDRDDGGELPRAGLTVVRRFFDSFESQDAVDTPGGTIKPTIKTAVDYGSAMGRVVEFSENRFDYLVVGNPLNQLADLEPEVNENSVTLSANVLTRLGEKNVFRSRQFLADEYRDQEFLDGSSADIDTTPISVSDLEVDRFPELNRFFPEEIAQNRQLLGNRSQWLAEVRRVTPLFVNVSFGAEPPFERVREYYRAVYNVVGERGGTYLSSDVSRIGMTLLFLFGVPRAQEYHEDAALDSALTLQGREADDKSILNQRFGLASGQVLAGMLGNQSRMTYTALGDALNTAARCMDAARWSQILSRKPTLTEARDEYHFDLENRQVKGKQQQVNLATVHDRREDQENRDTELTELVGRGEELEIFRKLVRTSPQSLLIEVTGEAGIGKTALVDEFSGIWSRDGRVVRASGVPTEVNNAYLLWKQLLWRYFELGRSPDRETVRKSLQGIPEVDRPYLMEILGFPPEETDETGQAQSREKAREDALIRTVQQATDTLWVVDDLQWVDGVSRRVLSAMLDDLEQGNLVLSGRESIGEQVDSARLKRMELSGLGLSEAQQLAREVLEPSKVPTRHKVREFLQKSDGNPLFLRELFRLLSHKGSPEEVPNSIKDVIQPRVDRLRPVKRQVLRSASVIGDTFYSDLLTVISPVDLAGNNLQEVLEELESDGFVRNTSGKAYQFRNTLLRESVYENVPSSIRMAVHGDIGEALENRENSSLELVAWHFHQAERAEKAARYSHQAGDQSVELFNYTNALVFYQRAQRWYRELDDEASLAEVIMAEGDVQKTMGQYSEARECFEEAADLFGELGNDLKTARALDQIGVCAQRQGRHEESTGYSKRALRELPDIDDPEVLEIRAKCLNSLSVACWYRGDYKQAIQHGKQSVDLRRNLGRTSVADALFGLGNSYAVTCQFEEARDCFGELRDRSQERGDRAGEAYALDGLGVCNRLTGRFRDALNNHRKSHHLRSQLEDPRAMCYSTLGLASTWLKVGPIQRVEGLLNRAQDEIEGTEEGNLGGELKRVKGIWHLVKGEIQRAQHALEEARKIGEDSGFRELYVKSLSPLANVLLRRDRLKKARSTAWKALEVAREHDIYQYVVWSQLMLGDWNLIKDDTNQAKKHWVQAEDIARAHSLRPLEVQALKRMQLHGGRELDDRRQELVDEMAEGLGEDLRTFIQEQSKQLPGHLRESMPIPG